MSEDNPEPSTKWIYLWLTVAAIVLLWLGSGAIIYAAFKSPDRGIFGDMFGAINALFSGLAFAGLIFAILMQREELKLQRTELRLQRQESEATRIEIQGQKEQAIAQNSLLTQQRFENTFFQLLDQHHSLINDLILTSHEKYQGRRVFEILLEKIHNGYSAYNAKSDILADYTVVVKNMDASIEHFVGHYFRSLLELLKYIDTPPSNFQGNAAVYSSMIISHLSGSEVAIVLAIVAVNQDHLQLKSLIQKYGLLRNLQDRQIGYLKEFRGHFDPSAFKHNEL